MICKRWDVNKRKIFENEIYDPVGCNFLQEALSNVKYSFESIETSNHVALLENRIKIN